MKTDLEQLETQKTSAPPAANTRGRRRAFSIFFIVLLVAAIAGLIYWLHARQFESTEDAEVDAHLAPISSRIDGTITSVLSMTIRR